MLGDILQTIWYTLNGFLYGLRLEQSGDCFAIVGFWGERILPIERLTRRDEKLARFAAQFVAEEGRLVVPLPRLSEARRFLESVPDSAWFAVDIAPEVRAFCEIKVPPGFKVEYAWSDTDAVIERRLQKGVCYGGDGWFLASNCYWHVEQTNSNDDQWLRQASISGSDIVRFLGQKVPDWTRRSLPYVSSMKYYNIPVLQVAVMDVADDQVALEMNWRAPLDSVRDIPSLPGYVLADDTIRPGISPRQLPKALATRSGSFSLSGQNVPYFQHAVWPKVRAFAKGKTDELLKRHKLIEGDGELVVGAARQITDGVGTTLAVPALACGGYRFNAETLSRKLETGTRFIRVAGGWLPTDTIRKANIAGSGRMTDGTPLSAIPLSPAEVFRRGSARLEGPWSRIEFPSLTLPNTGTPEDIAKQHLEFLLKWGIPGGLLGTIAKHGGVLRDVFGAFVANLPDARILVVGAKEDLDVLQQQWAHLVTAWYDGGRRDPEFSPVCRGLIVATPKALEVITQFASAKWNILCIIAADELIKTSSSRLFSNLTALKRGITFGLFADRDFAHRAAKREAMSGVFGIADNDSELVWTYSLRNPEEPAPGLPAPYRLLPRVGRTAPAEFALGKGEDTGAVRIPSVVREPRPARIKPQVPQPASLEDWGIRIEVRIGHEKFLEDATKFADRRGTRTVHIPFMSYWPTYDSMTKEQQHWYFYWRSQIRHGEYPDTDLSYIFVHVYELINGVGVKDPTDGYGQLRRLWLNYRERQPRLDNYLVDWLADYVVVWHCPITPVQVYTHAWQTCGVFCEPDLLLAQYVGESLDKLPIGLIDRLTDYRIRASKFNKQHAGIVDEWAPKVIEQVNAYLLQERNGGILALFRPRASQPLRRYAFRSAVYCGASKEIVIADVVPYSQHTPLREFLTAVVKHAENGLREMKGYRGRLRGYDLEPEIQAVINRFISGVKEAIIPPPPKPKVVVDFEAVKALREESDEVREMLLAEEKANMPAEPRLVPEPQPVTVGATIVRPPGTPDGLLTDLDPVNKILERLDANEKRLVEALMQNGWEWEETALAATMNGVFVEPIVDRINSFALDQLGDMLIATESGKKVIADDYRDELEYLLRQPAPAPLGPLVSPTRAVELQDLPAEWAEFLSRLSAYHVRALKAILRQNDPVPTLRAIAAENASMPELLVDAINELAMETIGDVIIAPGSAPPVVEDEDRQMVERLVQLAA